MRKRAISVLLGVLVCSLGMAQEITVGLIKDLNPDEDNYLLFAPMGDKQTYLINRSGWVVHTWDSEYTPGLSQYLIPDGSLYKASVLTGERVYIASSGSGGLIEKLAWDGTPEWQYKYSSEKVMQHHDIEVMPNGNVLILAWEIFSEEEAIQAGRNPELLAESELWPDHVVEVEPTGLTTGNIVWEWHVWDHLVQDFDETKDNYGMVTDHPQLIDINYVQENIADWNHGNSVSYNEDLDQIVVSIRSFNELWVIDHSTTTAEAKTHEGGASGKGGDILFRYGNPRSYQQGGQEDQVFYAQHDAKWIQNNSEHNGALVVFSNGTGRKPALEGSRPYSTVDIIKPIINSDGSYQMQDGVFELQEPTLVIGLTKEDTLFASIMSGAQPLDNGNFLVTHGPSSVLYEVDVDGNVFWKYASPLTRFGPMRQGEDRSEAGFILPIFRALSYPSHYPAFDEKILRPLYKLELPAEDILLSVRNDISKIKFFPNPAKETLEITFNSIDTRLVQLISLQGQVVYSEYLSGANQIIAVANFPRGVYVIKIGERVQKLVLD